MPGKKQAFTRASILFRPHMPPELLKHSRNGEFGGGAGYRPRVRIAYYTSRLSP